MSCHEVFRIICARNSQNISAKQSNWLSIKMTTEPCVFIIESLRISDEDDDLYEGKVLSEILRLSKSKAKYIYIRTIKELEMAIEIFKQSKYRYLHISCHGAIDEIYLSLESLTFYKLGQMLGTCPENQRVFFSSCKVVNSNLARTLIRDAGCLSVMGPSKNINFGRATVFWASFYHLMLRKKARSMNKRKIVKIASSLRKEFDVDMSYFNRSKDVDDGFEEVSL